MQKINVGDFVLDRVSGYKGRVFVESEGCPANYGWLKRQTRFGPNPMRFVNSEWANVVIDEESNRDPHLLKKFPVDLLERVEPFLVRNEYTRWYFTDWIG